MTRYPLRTVLIWLAAALVLAAVGLLEYEGAFEVIAPLSRLLNDTQKQPIPEPITPPPEQSISEYLELRNGLQ